MEGGIGDNNLVSSSLVATPLNDRTLAHGIGLGLAVGGKILFDRFRTLFFHRRLARPFAVSVSSLASLRPVAIPLLFR